MVIFDVLTSHIARIHTTKEFYMPHTSKNHSLLIKVFHIKKKVKSYLKQLASSRSVGGNDYVYRKR